MLSLALWGPATCTSGGDTTVADIYNPSGQLVASLSSGCGGAAMNLTLTNSGVFTILVHESAYRRTVSYQMSIQSVTGGGCNGTAIACGQTVANTTTYYSQMDPYSYVGTAGQMLSLALWGPATCTSGGDTTVADIYNPSGQLVASLSSGCGGAAMNLTLTNSGVFTILVHESAYRRTVSYQMSIQSVTGGGCNDTAIACGQTVANTTTYYSQMDPYSYVGTAGQMLSLALWGPATCTSGGDTTVADIYNPSGQLIASLSSGCAGGAMNLTLTNSGVFTILVHESAYQRTVSYQMSIQSVTGGGCNGTAIACGQTVANTTTYYSQMDPYSYVGTAGQMLSLALWGPATCTSGGDTTLADIYNPSGQLIASLSSGCSGAAMNLTLTSSGIFTILDHESAYRRTVSYQMSIQSVTGGGCNGKIISCGQTINGQIRQDSQMNAYALVASAGEHVILSDSGSSGIVVDMYDPTGSKVVSMGISTSTNYTFADTGIYTVVVHSGSYNGTGSYSLDLTVFGGCAQEFVDLAVVTTNQSGCLPIVLDVSSPVIWVSFTVETPPGIFSAATIESNNPFTNATITPGTNSQWFVTMQASSTNEVTGVITIGAICFTTETTQSAFVPIGISNLVVSNTDGFIPGPILAGGTAVVIANQSLLQAGWATNGQRMYTLYGKPNTPYEIEYATNVGASALWFPLSTNTLPSNSIYTSLLQGSLSNARSLFIRALEK